MQKRIKRHVKGRSREFFIAVAPDLIKLCHDELLALALPLEQARIVSGGIEIKGRLPVCYLANLHLRTANRILMRLDRFAATNFRQLGKKIAAFPWELYLYAQTPLTFHVTAKHSRLYHTDAISDTVRTGIVGRLDSRGVPFKSVPADVRPQQIFVRVADDQFLLSIDSTGTSLYKRGLKQHGGPAPLRETLASAVLTLAGYDSATILLDPMCGTGTFALEAAMRAAHIPAGWHRTFAFMQWPAFSPGQWDYLKKKAGENIRTSAQPQIFASDKDRQLCTALSRTVASAGLSPAVKVQCRDFFDVQLPPGIENAGLVVLNPPYGRRLGTGQEGQQRIRAIGAKLRGTFPGWRLGLLVPHKHWLRTLTFDLQTHPLQHGGLRLLLAVGTISVS